MLQQVAIRFVFYRCVVRRQPRRRRALRGQAGRHTAGKEALEDVAQVGGKGVVATEAEEAKPLEDRRNKLMVMVMVEGDRWPCGLLANASDRLHIRSVLDQSRVLS